MKKNSLLIFALLFVSLTSFGQTILDMGGLNTPNINGTARYMGMAGSFGAIGGDISAVGDNPAILGMYRWNEINVSLKVMPTSSHSNWEGNIVPRNLSQKSTFSVNNATWALTIPSSRESGYLSTGISFGYHRVKDFDRMVRTKYDNLPTSITDYMVNATNGLLATAFNKEAYNNVNIGWLSILGYDAYLISPEADGSNQWTSNFGKGQKVLSRFQMLESGSIGEFNFTYSGNVNNKIYFGAGISVQNYSKLQRTSYREDVESDYFDFISNTSARGAGFNAKLGVVWRANNWLRLGASFISPSFYHIKNEQNAEIRNNKATNNKTPNLQWSYNYSSPLKMQASAGIIVGGKAAINVDYQIMPNQLSRFSGLYDNPNTYISEHQFFDALNKNLKSNSKIAHAIKLGAELKANKILRLRAGLAYVTTPLQSNTAKRFNVNEMRTDMYYFNDKNSIYASTGLGLVFNNIFLDFAYMYNRQNQYFMPFSISNVKQANIGTNFHNFVATLAIKY